FRQQPTNTQALFILNECIMSKSATIETHLAICHYASDIPASILVQMMETHYYSVSAFCEAARKCTYGNVGGKNPTHIAITSLRYDLEERMLILYAFQEAGVQLR